MMQHRSFSLRPFYLLLFTGLFVLSASFLSANQDKEESTKNEIINSSTPPKDTPLDQIIAVLRSPRCMNCHPSGDRPRQGDDMRIHNFNVMRGADDHGGPVQKCNTCHQAENNAYTNVPGAPHWGLAPRSMGWIGLSDYELIEAILDPAKNGNRSPEQIVEHMSHDALVLWAWEPGEGRTLPPVDVERWRAALAAWLAQGTPLPAQTTAKEAPGE